MKFWTPLLLSIKSCILWQHVSSPLPDKLQILNEILLFRLNFTLRRGKCQFQPILMCLVQHWSQVYDCFVNQLAPKIRKLQFLLVIFWSQLSSNNICQKIYINRTQRLRSTWGKWGSVPDGPLWVTTQYALINPTPNLLPLLDPRVFQKKKNSYSKGRKATRTAEVRVTK